MIIIQSNLTLNAYFNEKYFYETTNQSSFWDLMIFLIFDMFVILNAIKLYQSTLTDAKSEENIYSKKLWYLINLVSFCIVFTGFIIMSIYMIAHAVDNSTCKWIEFALCVLSIFSCFLCHVTYFVYKKASPNYKSVSNIVNNAMSFKVDNLVIEDHEIPDADRLSEITMFIIFHMIFVHIMTNLLYFNSIINIWVNLSMIIILNICVIYFGGLGIVGIASSLMIVLLYFNQIYKQICIAFTIDSKIDGMVDEINDLNSQLGSFEDQISSLGNQMNEMNSANQNLQSSLIQSSVDNGVLQGSLTDSISISNNLRNYQVQVLTNQLNNILNMLQKHNAYLMLLKSVFSTIIRELEIVNFAYLDNLYYSGYVGTIGGLITQVENVIAIVVNDIANVSTLQNSDINYLNSSLQSLLSNDNFIRSHLFFDTPVDCQNIDSGNFTLLYELYFRIFANFFRNNNNVPWNYSNENVVRDTILYVKNTPIAYNALSVYSKSLVDQLYILIDGSTVFNILGGQVTNDTNTQQMNNAILNGSNYSQIYNGNGVEYCNLVFTLATQPDFFVLFDPNSVAASLNWQLSTIIIEDTEQYLPNNFGFITVQSI